MTEENARLIEENYSLFYAYFHRHHIQDEDLKQELILSLCQHIDAFDPTRGAFSTFVYTVFNNSIANYLKRAKIAKERLNQETIHLDDNSLSDDGKVNLHDLVANTVDTIGDEEYKIAMTQILELLSHSAQISQSTLRTYVSWLKTNSFADSSRELHMSRQAVQQSVTQVQKYLRSLPGMDWRKI